MFGIFANAVIDSDSPEIKMIEDACLANLENNVHDPELRERLRPDVPRRVQAADHLARLLRRDPAAERRARHRGDRTRSSPRACARATAGSTSSTCSCSRPASRPTRSCARCRSSAATGTTLDEAWARAPERVPVDLDPRLPELLHAQRTERAGRQLLADRGRRAAVRATSCSSSSASAPASAARSARAARRWTSSRPRAPRRRKNTVWVTGCRSWYLDDRGIPATWPWSFDRFRAEMREPALANFELR